jgi:hypothetical protein
METDSRQEKLEKLRKFWKTHLENWEESGQNQREYCRQHNLIYHRFVYWKARFKSRNLPVKFVQVASSVSFNPGPFFLKLHLPRGCQVEIPDDFSEDTLKRLLTTLQELQ